MGCLVKICGVRKSEHALAAARAGADFIGFVFASKSPRTIAPDTANDIVTEVKQRSYDEGFALPKFCGLFVNPGEKQLAETAPFLTHFQFHGQEDADRISEIRDEFGLEVIKAIGIGGAEDFDRTTAFATFVDLLLFDAKPPRDSERAGGLGVAFDWSLLSHYRGDTSFLVAGGLTPGNVGAAIRAAKSHTAFAGVDVSSGVETRPGEKDVMLIGEFVSAVKEAK